jgi:hypothetical protein
MRTYADPETLKVPLPELISACPEAVDPSKKELYLTDADFTQVFAMTRAQFAELR